MHVRGKMLRCSANLLPCLIGAKFSLNGRSEVIYLEGKRKALIGAEMMSDPIDFVIYFESFSSWQPPFEKEIITDEKRQEIRLNISKEFATKGLTIE